MPGILVTSVVLVTKSTVLQKENQLTTTIRFLHESMKKKTNNKALLSYTQWMPWDIKLVEFSKYWFAKENLEPAFEYKPALSTLKTVAEYAEQANFVEDETNVGQIQ